MSPLDPRYETAGQRCPKCGHRFRVLADEQGDHPCPRCGYHPDDASDEEGRDDEC